MHLLVDAFSVNNLSGRHVLAGHVREIHARSPGTKLTVLLSQANATAFADLPSDIDRYIAPVGGQWLARVAWQWRHGARFCSERAVDAIFSPSGMLSTGMPRPQLVLAQNPWPMVARGAAAGESMKLFLQRRTFARAQHEAAVMAFNSVYMRDLYAAHFEPRHGASVIAHQGIDEELFAKGEQYVGDGNREPIVLCVSVMARHKAVEILVAAFERVRTRVPAARLVLVGGWPDPGYRKEVEDLATSLSLGSALRIAGHVPQDELHSLYAGARVFCLPSRCESFGIPAVEAQAFGTPAVVASGTAAPEIVGRGGIAVPQDDFEATAQALLRYLGADLEWRQDSFEARTNAQRFHWRECSTPLLDEIERLGAQASGP